MKIALIIITNLYVVNINIFIISICDISETPPPIRRPVPRKPVDEVRYDHTDHLPEKRPVRGRCVLCVKNQTDTYCSKCNVRLCFTHQNNCFMNYHQNP